jgi:hypothetical protein
MRNIFLAAGVAALAISAPAASKPENKGNQGGGAAAQAQQGGGQKADRGGRGGGERQEVRGNRHGGGEAMARADRGQQMRVDRGPMRMAQAERGRGNAQADRGPDRVKESRQVRVERPQRQEMRQARVDRQQRQDIKVRGNDRSIERMANRGRGKPIDSAIVNRGGQDVRIVDNNVRVRDYERFQSRFADNRALGLIDGCPPGLAKKTPACVPPGQAKKLVGTLLPTAYRSSFLPDGLRDYWRDNDDYYYRYNNEGYLYQVNRDTNLISSLLPLFGGGYTLGQTFPYQSSAYYMPSYYQPFYQDSADMLYRYDNGYVYGIDPYSGMIDNIIPAYDNGYGVGQMLPASYSYYNLPYPYRSYYSDNNDYYYRYAPGAIYQVDRDSQLISAVVSLLGGGLGVGQQLPLGYSAYNVPLSYRDQYYDTPDNWYRYSNGYIYQVDPTTQLITAVIDAIV